MKVEDLALIVHKYGSNRIYSSEEAAKKIKENILAETYAGGLLLDTAIDSIAKIIKEYRSGLALEDVANRILLIIDVKTEEKDQDDLLGTLQSLQPLQLHPQLSFALTIPKQNPHSPNYIIGDFYETWYVDQYFPKNEWIECDGRAIFKDVYIDLYLYLKAHEQDVDLLIKSVGAPGFIFNEMLDYQTGKPMFDIPYVMNYSIRVL